MKCMCSTVIKVHSLHSITMRTRQKTIIPLGNIVAFHPRLKLKHLILLFEREWSLSQMGGEGEDEGQEQVCMVPGLLRSCEMGLSKPHPNLKFLASW